MHGKREQKLKSSRSPAKQSWSVNLVPCRERPSSIGIAIAEPLHSEIASTSPVYDCAKGIEMHKRPSIGARRSC